jgi:hypothetical protein
MIDFTSMYEKERPSLGSAAAVSRSDLSDLFQSI